MFDTPKKPTRLWVRILRCAVVVVLIPLLMLYLLQNKMLYFPDTALPALAELNFKDVEEVSFVAGDGTKLVSWYLPPKSKKPTLIYFQGNAGNISDRSDRIHDCRANGWGLLLLGYRGYGRSEGSPDEPGLYQDSRAALAWLRARPEVDAKKLVYHGESLGCAVAIELAAAEAPAALVCEAPFLSLKAVASVHYPWLPTSLLVRSKFDNEERIRKVKCPVLIVHGTRDQVCPFAQGRAVFEAACEPKRFHELDAYHNDIPERGGADLRKLMKEFVEDALK